MGSAMGVQVNTCMAGKGVREGVGGAGCWELARPVCAFRRTDACKSTGIKGTERRAGSAWVVRWVHRMSGTGWSCEQLHPEGEESQCKCGLCSECKCTDANGVK